MSWAFGGESCGRDDPPLAETVTTMVASLVRSQRDTTMPPSSPPSFDQLPDVGLHVLKDKWKQKKYLGPQSKLLAKRENLSAAILATFDAAPERRKDFRLDRKPTKTIGNSQVERQLEAAILERWSSLGMWPIPGAWTSLVAFQVPLFNEKDKGRWGYIDLLGVNSQGLPVVVELKKTPTAGVVGRTGGTETPLRMVLEAAAYAIALRKNWPRFKPEWTNRLMQLGVSKTIVSRIPEKLETVPLVAAAPASFWMDWLPVTERGRTVTSESWRSFRSLLDQFNNEKLPVSFVSISGHKDDKNGFAVQPLVGFPLVQ